MESEVAADCDFVTFWKAVTNHQLLDLQRKPKSEHRADPVVASITGSALRGTSEAVAVHRPTFVNIFLPQ